MSAIYTVRCDEPDCIEVFNPVGIASSRYALESARVSARARGWQTVIKGGEVRDYCNAHASAKHERKAKP